MIATELLELHKAKRKKFLKEEIIFKEGNNPHYYYQIIAGEVKMCNFNDAGREFIQGFFQDGQSFGEPSLFLNRAYPANALATTDCELYLVPKINFLELIQENDQVSHK